MIDLLIDVVCWALILVGSVFLIIGGVGLLRMPDVFTRMHAASVSDTVGVALLFLAMILQAGFSLVTAKLLFILAILFFTGPLATHAIARAALSVGVEPKLFDEKGRKRGPVPLDLSDADDVPRSQRWAGFAAAELAPSPAAKDGSGKRGASSRAAGTAKRKTAGAAKRKARSPSSKPKGGGSSKR